MKRHYCTYLDRNYLAKGLALIESLRSHEPDFSLYVICLDEISRVILKNLDIPGVVPMPLHEFECGDESLLSIRPQRSLVEYYWTLTPTLILRLLERNPRIDALTYLDADLFFFSSPDPIFKEFGRHSVLIHEHRFSPALAPLARESGKFNVGLLCFRNDVIGKSVLNSWRKQCIEWCFSRYEDGKMGDQMYLNDWPDRFSNVRVLRHIGGGVAPWNNDQYRVSVSPSGNPLVNGSEVIFYHFHSLGILSSETLVLAKHLSYRLSLDVIKLCYLPYADALARAIIQIHSIQPDFDFGLCESGVVSEGHVFFKKTGTTTFDSKNAVTHRRRKLSASWDCFLSSQALEPSEGGVRDAEFQLWTEGRTVQSEDDLLLTLKGRSICQTIRVLYVVGAHEFQEDKLLRELFPNLEQIYLFEPIPEMCKELAEKLSGRPGLEVLPVALGDRNGKSNFFVTNNRASSSLLTLGEHKRLFPHVSVQRVIQVDCRTLESVISERKLAPPDMLFLDVQGAEYQILSSVSPQLLQRIHLIYTEASKEEVYQGARNLDDLKRILSRDFAFLGFAPLANICPTHGNALFVNQKHLPRLQSDASIVQPVQEQTIQSLILAGFSQFEEKRWEAALGTFERALALEPLRQGISFLCGRCLFELNRLQEAAQALEVELNIQPNHPDARLLLGEIKRRLTSPSPSISSCQQAIFLCEQASQLWLTGKTGEALPLLDEALRMESSLLGAHYARALCLQQMGQIAAAESAVRQEILLQPDHREARKLFHSLRKRQAPVVRPPIFKESQLAHQMLDGLKGLEIGPSSHNPFGLNSRYVGQRDEIYEQEQLRIAGKVTVLDFVARADEIPVESESEDYILSSHLVEHCPNLVKTLLEWFRIVKPGGCIYMIVPHRDAAPSDVGRPLTDWDHLLEDYRDNRTPETEPEAGKFLHCHYHVFAPETMKRFIHNIFGERLLLVASQEIDDKVGNGFTLVYRKLSSLSSSYPWSIGNPLNPVVISRLLRPEETGHRSPEATGIPNSVSGSKSIQLSEHKHRSFGTPEPSAQQLAWEGFQRFEEREWRIALDCFDQAIKVESQKPGINFLRAQCFFRLEQWKDAERAVFAELKIQPNHPDTRDLLLALRQQQKLVSS